jgi:hypothetical protein
MADTTTTTGRGNQQFAVGDKVEVFYRIRRFNKDECLAVSCTAAGLLSPVVGISDGWQPATIIMAPDKNGEYKVQYDHKIWFSRDGTRRESDKFWDRVGPWILRRRKSVIEAPYCKPALSVFVVRWGKTGDLSADPISESDNGGDWGHTGTSVCDRYINTMGDVFYSHLGPDFEIVSVFIHGDSDLVALSNAAPMLASMLTGRHIAAFYHLWPTAFQDGDAGAAGMVPEKALFQLMQVLPCLTCVPLPAAKSYSNVASCPLCSLHNTAHNTHTPLAADGRVRSSHPIPPPQVATWPYTQQTANSTQYTASSAKSQYTASSTQHTAHSTR